MILHNNLRLVGPKVYAYTTQLAGPADANENTVLSFTVPGGSLGPNGHIEFKTLLSATNNANAKTYRLKVGGSTITSVNIASNTGYRINADLANRNNQAVQVSAFSGTVGYGGSAAVTYAVNTANDVTVSVTLQKANGTDSFAVEFFAALVYYGA